MQVILDEQVVPIRNGWWLWYWCLQPKSCGFGTFSGSQVARSRHRRKWRPIGGFLQDKPSWWGMQSLWSLRSIVVFISRCIGDEAWFPELINHQQTHCLFCTDIWEEERNVLKKWCYDVWRMLLKIAIIFQRNPCQ